MANYKMTSSNMFYYVIILLLFIYICMVFIFQYLIKRNKIKPNRVSKQFYQDDEDFLNSYEKIKEKGMVKYMVENIIYISVMVGIIGVFVYIKNIKFLGVERKETIVVALIFGAVWGLIQTLADWSIKKKRYLKIKIYK